MSQDTLIKDTKIPNIYNTYLKIKRQGKPYTKRKDFDTLDKKTKDVLVKLSNLFSVHDYISIEDFFAATLNEVPDAPLDYFTTSQAINRYTAYKETLNLQIPDTDEMIKRGKENAVFICRYCLDNKITITEYGTYVAPKCQYPQILLDIKKLNVLLYTALCIPEFDSMISTFPQQLTRFLLGESIYKLLAQVRGRLYSSKRFKPTLQKILETFQQITVAKTQTQHTI